LIIEFLDTINQQKDIFDKSKCTDGIFKNVRTPVVGIHFLKKVFGVLVSRDPTVKFITYYEEARVKSPDDCRRFLLKTNALPVWIANRIKLINEKWPEARFSEESIARL
jgi:hypothetical protein